MYTISTSLIKAQSPGLTAEILTTYYKRELEEQSVSHVFVGHGSIIFTNDIFKIVLKRYANKFSGFSKGQIRIMETGTEFIVRLEASLSRIFITAALFAVASALFALIGTGLDFFPLVLAGLIFIVLSVTGYLAMIISFPVYFTRLRNDIESGSQQGER